MNYPNPSTRTAVLDATRYSLASWRAIADFSESLNHLGQEQQRLCENTVALLDSAHTLSRWRSPAADTYRLHVEQMDNTAEDIRLSLNRSQRYIHDNTDSIECLARKIRSHLDDHQHLAIRVEQLHNNPSDGLSSGLSLAARTAEAHRDEIEHHLGQLTSQVDEHLRTITRHLLKAVHDLAELEPVAALGHRLQQPGSRERHDAQTCDTAGDIARVLLALQTYRNLLLPAQTPQSTRAILAKLSPAQRVLFSQACPEATFQVCSYHRSESQLLSDVYSDPSLHLFAKTLQAAKIHTLQPSPQDTFADVSHVAQAWSGIDDETRSYLIHAYPSVVGRLRGIPPSARFQANRLALQGYRWSLGPTNVDRRVRGGGSGVLDAAGKLAAVESLLVDSFHENPGTGARQILHFDPRGPGKLIEVIGTLNHDTTHLGVLVPGTGAQLTSHEHYVASSRYFLNAGDPDRMAQIVFSDGRYPSDVFSASERDTAHYTGKLLAGQMVELGQVSPVAKLTVTGYSYGGAIVGVSETYGMPADHVIHLSSPGMGTAHTKGELPIASPKDYPERDLLGRNKLETAEAPGTTRWTHTPPGDPIALAQELSDVVPGTGHGVDPEDFPGIRILPPGRYLPGYADPEKVGHRLGADVLDIGGGVEAHQDVHKPFTEPARAVGDIAFGQRLPVSQRVSTEGSARTWAQVAKDATYVHPGVLVRK